MFTMITALNMNVSRRFKRSKKDDLILKDNITLKNKLYMIKVTLKISIYQIQPSWHANVTKVQYTLAVQKG